MFRRHYHELTASTRRAFWVAVVMAFAFAVFAVTLIDTLAGAVDLRAAFVNSIPFVLSAVALVSALLILFGRGSAGSWLVLFATLALLLANATQAEGYGFSSAFILLAVTLYIPLQILEGRRAYAALGIGIAGSVGIILLDAFWAGPRVPALAQDTLFAGILAGTLFLALLVTTARQFNAYTIRTKLLIFALGTGLVSILSVAFFTNLYTQRFLAQEARDALVISARRTVDEIDRFIVFRVFTISSEAQLPQIVSYLKASASERANRQPQLSVFFENLAKSDPEFTSAYALLDKDGVDLVDTRAEDVGVDWSSRSFFIQPRTTGRVFISSASYLPDSSRRVFYISAPVRDGSGEFLGVLRVQFPFEYIEGIFNGNSRFAGEGTFAILLDDSNLILSHSARPDWNSRMLVAPDQATYNLLRTDARIQPDVAINTLGLDLADFAGNLRTVPEAAPYFASTDAAWGEPVEVGVDRSSSSPFLVAFVQPRAIALEAIDQQKKVTVVIALITGLIILLAVFGVERAVTAPIVGLAKVAEAVAGGDLSARAQYPVQDEVGDLARSFNHMTAQLQDTLGSLERRVLERTTDLETARLLSERRAQELHSISEISRTISTEQNLEILLPLVTRLVSEKFDFYHIGIFFVDGNRQFAVLQAANSEGGRRMIERGHRLEVGTGLVGFVAGTGQPRIALDVGTDAVFFNNPDLPETRSEMALPLNVRGQTIGVLDVQSTRPGAFTESDANTLGILADQVAIAIDNARLFGQSQESLNELQKLYRQFQSQEWSEFIRQEAKIGYRQTLTGGGPLEAPVHSPEIQKALQKGEAVVLDGKNERSHPAIAVPVKLRGQTLGVLNIKAPTADRKWSPDELNLVQVISDRIALALDNARLLQESQRRAAKEQKIGEMTARIGASINMRNVLQTAVEELGRALPGSEVIIQFQTPPEK